MASLLYITIMRSDLQHKATYHSAFCDFVPVVWSVNIRYYNMYKSFFLQVSKSSLLICASLNQMNKLGLLDR